MNIILHYCCSYWFKRLTLFYKIKNLEKLKTCGKILVLMRVFCAVIFFVSRAEWRVFFVLIPGLWILYQLICFSEFWNVFLQILKLSLLLQDWICRLTCEWGRRCPICGSHSWGRTAWNPGRVQNIKCVRRKSNKRRLPPQIFLIQPPLKRMK